MAVTEADIAVAMDSAAGMVAAIAAAPVGSAVVVALAAAVQPAVAADAGN
jgi:hypothetical protein